MPTASSLVSFRKAFISGLLLIVPLVVTVWAFVSLISFTGQVFGPALTALAVDAGLKDSTFVSIAAALIGTLLVVGLIALLGYVSRYVVGEHLLGILDRFAMEIPGVSTVYGTVKQIVSTFGRQGGSSFSKVVLVEFPHRGVWTIGFLTNKACGELQSALAGERWAVFVPTTPNPTSGFLLFAPRAEIVELEMSVGDGMKMVISGGVVVPPHFVTKTPPLPPSV